MFVAYKLGTRTRSKIARRGGRHLGLFIKGHDGDAENAGMENGEP